MISIIIPTLNVNPFSLISLIKNIILQDVQSEIIISEGRYNHMDSCFLDFKNSIHTSFPQDIFKYNIKLIQNKNKHIVLSRGQSINLAAKYSSFNILLFIHADMLLPRFALKKIIASFQDNKSLVVGGFLKHYQPPFTYSIYQTFVNARTLFFKKLVGTNAIFIKKDVFGLNPFPNHFMEDFVFSHNTLRQFSKKNISIIKDYVLVSSEKYVADGPIKAICSNYIIVLLFKFGVRDFKILKDIYILRKQDHKAFTRLLKLTAKALLHINKPII